MAGVGLGGYLMSRRPISLVRETLLAAPDVDELVVVFGSLETDLAITNPAVTSVRFGVITLGAFGLAPAVRRAVESGRVTAHPYGATSILRALQAGAREEPYALTRARPHAPVAVHEVKDAPGLCAVASLRPRRALLHVPYADPVTGVAWGYGAGTDLILAAAAHELHVSYDVATAAPPPAPNLFAVPAHLITQLVARPFGAFPSGCFPLYGPYPPHYAAHARAARDGEAPVAGADAAFVAGALDDDAGAVLGFARARDAAVADHRRELERWLARC